VIGALRRGLHGSREVTDELDIVLSTHEENLRRLGLALEELNTRRTDGARQRWSGISSAAACSSSRLMRGS
jgi:hypothetical protein